MTLIAHCSLSFAALHFVVITSYYSSLRLAKNKQQCTLSIIQLRVLGSIAVIGEYFSFHYMPVSRAFWKFAAG